jgi:RNA polymerase sigma-70 factor (ECF subfamily)
MIKITCVSSAADPVVHVRVEGRIVLRTAAEVAKACAAALAPGKPVLLDLAGVGFVDAEGGWAIAELSRRNVTVVGCSPFVGVLLRAHGERAAEAATDEGDDGPLVARLRRRDPTAAEEMLRRYGSRMLAVARRVLTSEDDARDAVHEAFLSAFESIDELPGSAQLSTWLRHMVAHAALLRLRSRRRTPEASLDALLPRFDAAGHWVDAVTPLPGLEGAHARDAVRRCLDRLPETFRTIVVLRDVEDLDTEEVATLLGTTATTVRIRLHRARQALRALLVESLAAPEARARRP